MFLILKIAVLVALIKMLLLSVQPGICAGIYTGFYCTFALLLRHPFGEVATMGSIVFGLTWLYFWLLDRYQDKRTFWVVFVLGLVILPL